MSENIVGDFRRLAAEVLTCIEEGTPLDELYPLLREAERSLHTATGPRNHPAFRIRTEYGKFVLVTSHPTLDWRHEARWDTFRPLSADEDNELREHVAKVFRAWLREVDRIRGAEKGA